MSLTSALFTGVSGLLNNGEAMSVIGNNIANVNTVGFKQARTLFSDQLSQSIGNNSQVGKGVQLQTVQNVFTQGSSQGSESVTDLSIQGNSFFALKSPTTTAPVSAQTSAFLSRAGAFHVDNTLTLVNPDGYQVLDTSGNPITFTDNAAGIAIAAANVATDVTAATDSITIDIATAQLVVDGMPVGTPAETAAKAAAQALVSAATDANNAAIAAKTTLDSAGTSANAAAANTAVSAALAALVATGTAPTAATSTAIGDVATNYSTVTVEEGKAFGKITKVEPNGLITYLGADGITQNYYKGSGVAGVLAVQANALGVQRLAVVTAMDPTALTKSGGSLYQATSAAGVSAGAFTLAGNQPNGTSDKVLSSNLEQSNVDMANEFVKMIVTQRAYSANSKTITTTDQMTQEVLNLIR